MGRVQKSLSDEGAGGETQLKGDFAPFVRHSRDPF